MTPHVARGSPMRAAECRSSTVSMRGQARRDHLGSAREAGEEVRLDEARRDAHVLVEEGRLDQRRRRGAEHRADLRDGGRRRRRRAGRLGTRAACRRRASAPARRACTARCVPVAMKMVIRLAPPERQLLDQHRQDAAARKRPRDVAHRDADRRAARNPVAQRRPVRGERSAVTDGAPPRPPRPARSAARSRPRRALTSTRRPPRP